MDNINDNEKRIDNLVEKRKDIIDSNINNAIKMRIHNDSNALVDNNNNKNSKVNISRETNLKQHFAETKIELFSGVLNSILLNISMNTIDFFFTFIILFCFLISINYSSLFVFYLLTKKF